ncbi:unnamed protein product [Gadus morhua 'NCC']
MEQTGLQQAAKQQHFVIEPWVWAPEQWVYICNLTFPCENDACRSEVVIMGRWISTVGTNETLTPRSGDPVSRTDVRNRFEIRQARQQRLTRSAARVCAASNGRVVKEV